MEPIPGIILRREWPAGMAFPPETAGRPSESVIDNFSRLLGLDDLRKPQVYVELKVKGWTERYYGSQTHDLPEVAQISALLQEHMPPAREAALIHNDYKYDNVVLDANDITKIAGVLDWEMCTIGDPLTDLGSALAYWVDPQDLQELQRIRWGPTNFPGSLTRAQLLERYAQTTGRDVSNMVFYLAFAQFKVAVIVQQIYYRYHQGLTKDARFAALLDVARILLRASLRTVETGSI